MLYSFIQTLDDVARSISPFDINPRFFNEKACIIDILYFLIVDVLLLLDLHNAPRTIRNHGVWNNGKSVRFKNAWIFIHTNTHFQKEKLTENRIFTNRNPILATGREHANIVESDLI